VFGNDKVGNKGLEFGGVPTKVKGGSIEFGGGHPSMVQLMKKVSLLGWLRGPNPLSVNSWTSWSASSLCLLRLLLWDQTG